MATYRPGGMSDSDESDNSDFEFVAPKNKIVQSSNENARGSCSGGTIQLQHAGMLKLNVTGTGDVTKKNLNANQRRSVAYWKQVNEAAKGAKALQLSPVKDPKEDPANDDYFRFIKQRNMGLRQEIENFPEAKSEYEEKIKQWKPIKSMVDCIEPADISKFPPINASPPLCEFKGRKVYWIDEECPTFNWMIEIISHEKCLVMDLEFHESHSFLGRIALIQIATKSCIFLIDPHPCFKIITKHLKPILEDPYCLKIMHGITNDYKRLINDFDIYLLAVIDIQLMHNEIRKDCQNNCVGLDDLASIYLCNYATVQSCTFEDWRRRPLTTAMMNYASNDVVAVVEIWDKLMKVMKLPEIRRGFEATKMLMINILTSYKRKTFPTALEELRKMKIMVESFSDQKLTDFELLHQWRQRYAAIIDDIPGAVATTSTLLKICDLEKPVTPDKVKSVGIPKQTEIQAATIAKILEQKSAFFTRLNNFPCHNCPFHGHAAIHCPFEKLRASQRVKQYMKLHPEHKTAQNRRRRIKKRENAEKKKNLTD